MPSIMRLFGALGGLDDLELRSTFNGGIGMVAVVEPAAADLTVESFEAQGIPATLIGEVVATDDLAGTRYQEASLESVPR